MSMGPVSVACVNGETRGFDASTRVDGIGNVCTGEASGDIKGLCTIISDLISNVASLRGDGGGEDCVASTCLRPNRSIASLTPAFSLNLLVLWFTLPAVQLEALALKLNEEV